MDSELTSAHELFLDIIHDRFRLFTSIHRDALLLSILRHLDPLVQVLRVHLKLIEGMLL